LDSRLAMLSSAWQAYSDLLVRVIYDTRLNHHPIEHLASLGVRASAIRFVLGDFEVMFLPGFSKTGGYAPAASPDWPWSNMRTVRVE